MGISTIIKYRNRLYIRYGLWYPLFCVVASIGISAFAWYSQLPVLIALLMVYVLVPLKGINYTHFSIDTQNIAPPSYNAKHIVPRDILVDLFSIDSLSLQLPVLMAAILVPQCALLLLCLIVATSILQSYFSLLLRRKNRMTVLYMIGTFPTCMFSAFYKNAKSNYLDMESWLHAHGLQLGLVALVCLVALYLLVVWLTQRLLDEHLFCSPEVMQKNTSGRRKKKA